MYLSDFEYNQSKYLNVAANAITVSHVGFAFLKSLMCMRFTKNTQKVIGMGCEILCFCCLSACKILTKAVIVVSAECVNVV